MRGDPAPGSYGQRLILAGLFLTLVSGAISLFARGESWLDQEGERNREAILRAGRILESPSAGSPIHDSRNQTYYPEGPDQLLPGDDSWAPVVPSTEDLLTLTDRARDLEKRGATLEALLLWKTIRRIPLVRPDLKGARVQAALATERINGLAKKEGFSGWDSRTDPVFLFDPASAKTCLFFDFEDFDLCFPGAWRVGGIPRPEAGNGPPVHPSRIQLKHGSTVFSYVRLPVNPDAPAGLETIFDGAGGAGPGLSLRQGVERRYDLDPEGKLCANQDPRCCLVRGVEVMGRGGERFRFVEKLVRGHRVVRSFRIHYEAPMDGAAAIRILTSILEKVRDPNPSCPFPSP